MNHKKRTALRRFTSVLMTLVMIFSLFPTGLAGRLGLVSTAEAAYSDDLSAQGDLATKIVQNAAKYLGYGYSQDTRLNGGNNRSPYTFDCSSLVDKALLDSGVGLSYSGGTLAWDGANAWRSANYEAAITSKTLSITYGGKTYTSANGGILYCDTVAAYNAAVSSSANASKFIVLTNKGESTSITQKPGTILLHPKDDATNSAAHMAIVAGTVTPNFTPKAGAAGTSAYWWNTYKYMSQVNSYFGAYLDTLATGSNNPEHYVFIGGGDKNAVLTSIRAVDTSITSIPDWMDTSEQHLSVYSSRQNYWNIWRTDQLNNNFLDYNGYYGIGSTVWRIEAGSTAYGVGLTNKIDGKGAYPFAYAIAMPGGYYYGLNAQKFTSNGSLDFAGPNGASGTYKNTTIGTLGLGGGKATFSVYKTIASNGTLSNAVVTNKVIDTPRGGDNAISGNPGGPDNLFNSYYSANASETFYIKEISSEYGQPRPGVWKVTMSGSSDSTGMGSTITAAVYYTSDANCASNTGGTNVLNESGHSGAWYTDGRTAFYEQGAAGAYANFEMVNQMTYDYWATIDLDKVVTGTSTRVANAGYIVLPANRSSFKYSGTPGTTSYSSYLGTQTFDAAIKSLNTDSAFRATYRGNTYTRADSLLRAIATYVNSKSTSAKGAATLYMSELQSVYGNKGSGTTLGSTDYMKNSEFGYYVTKADGTAQMFRIGTDGSGTVNVTDSTRQFFMLLDNSTNASTTATRDFFFLEIYAPDGYDFPSDAAYEAIRLSNSKAISSKSNENGANSGKLLTPATYGSASDFYSGTPYSVSKSANLTTSTDPYSYQSSLNALRGDDDRTQYFYSLNLLKWDNQGNAISNAATPAKFNIGTTIGGSQIASGVTVNSTTAVSAFTNYASTSSTAVFYITETQAATGTEKRAGYWKVEMNGNKSNGAASTVTNITYFKSTSQTTGGTVLGTTKTTNDEGWISNKTSTTAIAILNVVNNKYYLNLGMYKAPTFAYTRKTATYVLTTSKDTAFAIAAGTSNSNGIATVTTGSDIKWFFGDPAYALTSPNAVTLYIAEKTAPDQMEKDKGIYEVNITPGERSDGHDSVINWVKYYATSTSTGYGLEETSSTDNVHGRYGNGNSVYIVATDTKSHTVTKNGTAVTDGTIVSVTVELQDSTGAKITTKADGTAITNPVTLNSNGWTYTWTGLDSSKTYKTVETQVVYKQNGSNKTATATSTPSISDVFAASVTTGTTTTGSSSTHTNDEKTLNGGLGVMKVYTAADGTEHRANGVVFTVYSDAACQNAVTTLTTEGQGVKEYTLPSWYVSAGTTKTFYIKETSNTNATDATTGTALSLEAPDGTVIKAVVTGAAAKENSSVAYTNNETGAAVSSAKNGTYYLYYYKKINTTTPLYGRFVFDKVDFRNQPQAVSFNVYTTYTGGTLSGKVSTKEVTISGNPAKAVVSWTVAELENNAKWPSDGPATKTFYVQEDQASVPEGYDWNNTVYTVVVTGAADIANSTFTVNGSPVADSYEVVNQSKEYIGALGVYKWGYVAETARPIEGIVFSVYTDAACTIPYATHPTLTTGANGYAYTTITDYPGVTDGWHQCDGETQTFYLKETDVSNATVGGQHVDVIISDAVIKAVVHGHDAANTTAAFVTDYTGQSGTASISTGTYTPAGIPAVGVVHMENSIVSTKGALGVYKTDNNGRTVGGLQFDIWPGNATVPTDGTTTGSIAHIITNQDGYAFLDVSTLSDGTVTAGTMWLEGTTKTFKIRENKESAEEHDLVWKPDVIPATVTAVKKDATAYIVTYGAYTSNTTYNGATLAVLNQVNTAIIPHKVTKTFANAATENAVTELWVTLYDSTNKKVTADAYGNPITNPVNLMAQNGYTYTWNNLVEDVGNPYHASETKIVMKQYKFTTGGAVEEETITLDTAAAINEYFTRTESTQGTSTTLTNALKKYYYTLSGSKMSEKEENGNMSLEPAAGAKVSVGRGIDLTTGTLTDVIAENITIPAGQTSTTTLFAGFASANASETFYIIETTPATDNLIAPGYWTVTMDGVQGTGAASASPITDAKYYPERAAGVTPVAVGTTVTVEAAESARAAYTENTVSYLFTILNEHYKPLYGAFGVIKSDELGQVYNRPVTFSVYGKNAFAGGSLTGDAIATITTNNGFVSMDVSTVSDGVVPEGRWEAEKSENTKTFYLKETTAPGELIMSDKIIRVIVTGANQPESATASYAVYENGGWTALSVSTTKTVSGIPAAKLTANTAVTVSDSYVGYKTSPLNMAVIPNTRMKAAEVTKTWTENPYADSLVASIEITLYDQDGNKVTKDALGNNITNPVTVTSGSEFYQWKNLKFSDGTKELIYTAKETAINLANGTKVTGSDIAKYMTVTESEEEETKDVTDMGSVNVSVNSIVNTPDIWNNYFGVYKTDGTGASVAATFGVYTDAALQDKVADLSTTATKQTDTYNPGTWWATEGAKTYYIRETANDGSHVLYPFTIKVTITGNTRVYEVVTDGLSADEIADLCEKAGVSSTAVTAEAPNAALVYILNSPIEVHISKLDISNDVEVEGATLTVYKAVENENGEVEDTVTGKKYNKGDVYDNETWVSTDTEHVIHNIQPGTYILSEVTAPTDHGYVTASDIVFTIDNGKLTHTVTMYDERTELHIAKRDFTDGSDVPGAVLELIDANDKSVIRWTTGEDTSIEVGPDYAANGLQAKADKDGNDNWIIVINYIPVGEYTLTEVTAPSGYLRAESIPVTVTDSAIVSEVEMKDKRKVRVAKIDLATDSPVADVTMTIYKYDENAEEHKGAVAYQWITTANRYTAIPGMDPGKYVLEETITASGYNTAADIEFEVNADQDAEAVITMYDKPLSTTISKTDITTGEKVIGAKLSVTTNQDITFEGTDYSAGDVIKEWITTDTDLTIDYIPAGSYTLTEILPPDEYGYVTANEIDFDIVDDKTLNEGQTTKIETKVEMKDDYTKVRIAKVNEYGELISGAKLEIRKATEHGYEDSAYVYHLPDGTEVTCAYTSTTTAIDVLYLPFGDYYLVEVESPDGFFTADPKAFTVTDSADLVSVTMTNTELSKLPSTGSMSDFMMKSFGILFVIAGFATALIGRRKKEEEAA